jgi:hypothetical protein
VTPAPLSRRDLATLRLWLDLTDAPAVPIHTVRRLMATLDQRHRDGDAIEHLLATLPPLGPR